MALGPRTLGRARVASLQLPMLEAGAIAAGLRTPLVGLIFGESYVLGGRDIALLAVGVAAHIGLVLVTQVLVAAVRHRVVAWSWLSGVVVATVILFAVPDLLLGAELAFLAGSATGWLVGTLLVLTTGRRERELQRA